MDHTEPSSKIAEPTSKMMNQHLKMSGQYEPSLIFAEPTLANIINDKTSLNHH
jgi:hypothetical protein